MLEYKKREDTIYQLKPEGLQIAKEGSHEARFWIALPSAGATPLADQEIVQKLGNDTVKFGRSQAIRLGWAKREASGYVRKVSIIISYQALGDSQLRSG
jgi:phenylalanyl-tRNA synthetase alpha chain